MHHASSAVDTPVPPAGAGVVACERFGDIDEQAEALVGWNQRYQQISRGAFQGAIHRVQLDGVSLFMEDLQRAVHQTGWVRPEVVALGVPLVLRGDARFCGQRDDEAALHVFSGADGFQFLSPERHVMLGIEVERSLFETHVMDESQAGPPLWGAQARLHRAPPAALAELRRVLVRLFDTASQSPQWLQRASSRAQMRDELLERLAASCAESDADGAGSPDSLPRRGSPSTQAALLAERARSYVEHHLDEPPTVADLCRELGVSRRTLQNSFHATWGMAPLAWLNTLRLNAVRRRLKTAASVTEAATQFGFWHFGHFATEYRALFGELPSQTLRRARGT